MVASPDRRMQRVLQFSMAATLLYVFATFFFGLRAHSLALISEAGHNLSDLFAIVLSFVAVYFQTRPANEQKTFGYGRAGVLAAFVNALTLIVLALWIAAAALHRLSAPIVVQPRLMMIVAGCGVIMNGLIAGLLWRFSRDVNIRSVFLHMLGDTLSTAAVIVGGAVIRFTGLTWIDPAPGEGGDLNVRAAVAHLAADAGVAGGVVAGALAIRLTGQTWIDPALSLAIAAMIVWSSYGIMRETLNILLEGTPRNLALTEVRGVMQSVTGVLNVHDLHIWSLGSNSHALASHVTVSEMPVSECEGIRDGINRLLREQFRIHHTTIQLETHGCETTHGCSAPPEAEPVGVHDHHGHAHHHH